MRILGKIQPVRQCFSHGGCQVLRVQADRPMGDTPAARHLNAITEALLDFSKQTLLSPATDALTDAVARGQGYRFTPHRVGITCQEAPLKGGACITLTFSLTVGDTVAWSRQMVTYWNETGAVQFPSPPRAKK